MPSTFEYLPVVLVGCAYFVLFLRRKYQQWKCLKSKTFPCFDKFLCAFGFAGVLLAFGSADDGYTRLYSLSDLNLGLVITVTTSNSAILENMFFIFRMSPTPFSKEGFTEEWQCKTRVFESRMFAIVLETPFAYTKKSSSRFCR